MAVFKFIMKGNHTIDVPGRGLVKFRHGEEVTTNTREEDLWYMGARDSYDRVYFKDITPVVPEPKMKVEQRLQETREEAEKEARARDKADLEKVKAIAEENRKRIESKKPAKGHEKKSDRDEFGPLKGTQEYKDLKHGDKIKLNNLRKEAAKKKTEAKKAKDKPSEPVKGPSLGDAIADDE